MVSRVKTTFQYSHWSEVLFRTLAVGIFLYENMNHVMSFEEEVRSLVIPALRPLPTSVAYLVHAGTVGLGLTGSLMFLVSGYRSKASTDVLRASRLLSIFMVAITWNWWFRRYGEFIWDVVDGQDRRMRTIHCLKNICIFGLILTLGSLASKEGRNKRI